MFRLLALFPLLFALANVAQAQAHDAPGEAAMLDRINTLRAAHQLAPLERLDALDGAARAHSAEMGRTGQLAHVSEATGTPEDRVRAAGVAAARVTENVASHRDTASAHEAVLGSDPHRQNVLDPDVTHLGLGAVTTERGVFVTQLFVRPSAPAGSPEPAPLEASGEAATPEPSAAPEAPSPFALIPPFLERAVEQAASPVRPMVSGAATPAAEEPDVSSEPDASSEPAAVLAPLADAPTEAAPAPAGSERPAASLSPAARSTLHELVELAQSLLESR